MAYHQCVSGLNGGGNCQVSSELQFSIAYWMSDEQVWRAHYRLKGDRRYNVSDSVSECVFASNDQPLNANLPSQNE